MATFIRNYSLDTRSLIQLAEYWTRICFSITGDVTNDAHRLRLQNSHLLNQQEENTLCELNRTFYSCCRFTDTRLLFVITRLRVFCHASRCEAEPTTSLPKLRKDKFIYTNKQSHKNRSSRRRSSKENKHQRRKMTKKTERRSGLHVCGRQLLHVQPALNMTQLLPAWSDTPERGETRRHRRRRQKHCANVIIIHLLRSDIWPHSVLRWCRNVSGGSARGAS